MVLLVAKAMAAVEARSMAAVEARSAGASSTVARSVATTSDSSASCLIASPNFLRTTVGGAFPGLNPGSLTVDAYRLAANRPLDQNSRASKIGLDLGCCDQLGIAVQSYRKAFSMSASFGSNFA